MTQANRFLVAIDETDASMRAVEYLARMVAGRPDAEIRLIHVLPPLPPELLETGGAPDEESQTRIEADQEAEQRAWIAEATERAQPVFDRARGILDAAGVSPGAVQVHAFDAIPEDRVPGRILDAARTCECGTVVMGRQARSWIGRMLRHHASESVVKQGEGFTVWVVE